MTFAKYCKTVSVIIFLAAIILAFLIANMYSTSDTSFLVLLVSIWMVSGFLCMFLYGLGVMLEYLHRIDNGFREVLKNQQKIAPVPEPQTGSNEK